MATNTPVFTTGKVAALAQDVLENNMNYVSSINQKYTGSFNAPEAIGTTLNIKEKLSPIVSNGQVAVPYDFKQNDKPITVNTQKHVAGDWGAIQTEQEIRNFASEVLDPEVKSLAVHVESDIIAKTIITAPIYSASAISVSEILMAQAHLTRSLADTSNLKVMLTPVDQATMITGLAGQLNPIKEIARQYKTGVMGKAYEMEFMSNNLMGEFETGTSTDRIGAVAVNMAEGANVISISGLSATSTLKAGEAFTIPGIYEVNYQTKKVFTGVLKQFIVAEDATTDGAGAVLVTITEKQYAASTSQKNVNALPAAAEILTLFGNGNSSYSQSLVYDPNFATAAFLKMPKQLGDLKLTPYMQNGIGIGFGKQGDLSAYSSLHRFDTVYGCGELRGYLARRVIKFS